MNFLIIISCSNISRGVLPSNIINSNELVTKYTIDAEKATQMATGILIDTRITSRELSYHLLIIELLQTWQMRFLS